MTARAPLGAPAVWLAVVDRDGGRCTCTGGCGRRHRDPTTPNTRAGAGRRGPGANAIPTVVERCPAGTGPVPVDLHVVPADPTLPPGSAWNLPVTALTTRCPDCATRTVRRATAAAARSAQDDTPTAQAGPVDLFDLLTPDPTPDAATTASSSGGACSVAVPAVESESVDPSVCPGPVRDVLPDREIRS